MCEPGYVPSLIGAPVRDARGVRVGRVADVLHDTRTMQPGWLLVGCRDRPALVPHAAAMHRPHGVDLRCDEERLEGSAALGPLDLLTADRARPLLRHFGVLPTSSGPWAGLRVPSAASVEGDVAAAG